MLTEGFPDAHDCAGLHLIFQIKGSYWTKSPWNIADTGWFLSSSSCPRCWRGLQLYVQSHDGFCAQVFPGFFPWLVPSSDLKCILFTYVTVLWDGRYLFRHRGSLWHRAGERPLVRCERPARGRHQGWQILPAFYQVNTKKCAHTHTHTHSEGNSQHNLGDMSSLRIPEEKFYFLCTLLSIKRSEVRVIHGGERKRSFSVLSRTLQQGHPSIVRLWGCLISLFLPDWELRGKKMKGLCFKKKGGSEMSTSLSELGSL